jgi:hypothetical protein
MKSDNITTINPLAADFHKGDYIKIAGSNKPYANGPWVVESVNNDCTITIRKPFWLWMACYYTRNFFISTIPNLWRRVMKMFIALFMILLFGSIAFAETEYDYVIITKTGYAQVWHNLEKRNGQYCTQRSLFEDCISAKDIKSIKQVEPGTVDAREVGVADTAGLDIMSDNMWAAMYDEKEVADKKNRDAADDRARANAYKKLVRKHGKDKADRVQRYGNSE